MDKKKIQKLHNSLINNILDDLHDPMKCTPGLYEVARGVLNDNKELLDSIPNDTLDFLEQKLTNSIPFRKEAS